MKRVKQTILFYENSYKFYKFRKARKGSVSKSKKRNIWPDGLREYISIKYDINFNQLTHLGIIEPYYDQ